MNVRYTEFGARLMCYNDSLDDPCYWFCVMDDFGNAVEVSPDCYYAFEDTPIYAPNDSGRYVLHFPTIH